eukprot:TRINITY_DN8381_c0_g1_i2.p1 TRINITY_DN8381_c0_g1~~TRINITY_DN8381_c0_g1_i2.p1  ORF type:complete len:214 (-),score=8.73 TRINITY_DN8381_c0_g1_i2:57-698(-)
MLRQCTWRAFARYGNDLTTATRSALSNTLGIPAAYSQSELNEDEYQRLATHTLDALQDELDEYIEDHVPDGDLSYEDGVMTISLGEKGTYVINKQAPNKQIWSSSPVSGPVRYDWDGERWIYSRDGHEMLSRLSEELTDLCGVSLSLGRAAKQALAPWRLDKSTLLPTQSLALCACTGNRFSPRTCSVQHQALITAWPSVAHMQHYWGFVCST